MRKKQILITHLKHLQWIWYNNIYIRIDPILTLSLLEFFIDSKVIIGTAAVENVVFAMEEDENI
jgi:hypothetical protein